MADIHELNLRRATAAEIVRALGYANVSADFDDRVRTDAQYRLAQDAWVRAEREYQDALAALSTDELMKLAAARRSAARESQGSPA